MSSLCKLFQSHKDCVPMLICSLFPHNGFLLSIEKPFYSALDPNMKKVYLFFYYFFKERLLMYVSKTEGLVYISNAFNLDIVKEVIGWGAGRE